jgi:hypothetical protein
MAMHACITCNEFVVAFESADNVLLSFDSLKSRCRSPGFDCRERKSFPNSTRKYLHY